jgi:D-arginine dehydrogenase
LASETADVIVIGAGIAGASLAHELAGARDVIVLECERQPGYHSTGRSAAMLIESYGTDAVQRLTRASRPFFEQPPAGFAETPLLSPRGYLHVATADQLAILAEAHEAQRRASPSIRRLAADQVCALAPLVDPSYVEAGLFEPDAMAIDVAALHQGYLKAFKNKGGRLVNYAVTTMIGAGSKGFEVVTSDGSFEAPLLINAAGAWADQVAVHAGVPTIGLVPKRRTALLLDPPAGADIRTWPMVTDIEDRFYVKPEGAALRVAPAEEAPVAPADVQPEELDIAIAVDRYQTLTGQSVRKVNHSCAGLRSFVKDRDPVLGFDPADRRFFWLAGRGGFGIMTAPAMARLAAALITEQKLPDPLATLARDLSPARLKQI